MQLTNAAYDLAEKQIRNGTASSQVVTHFLKLGSTREKIELEKLRGENQLIGAKIEQMESYKRIEALYSDAMEAMKSYTGQEPLELESGIDD